MASARPCGHSWNIPPGAAALQYAERGYAVLPLDPGTKKPHRMLGREGGVHHATADVADVARWWGKHPDANIGVATGSESHLIVVDLDIKTADGPEIFWRFLVDHQHPVSWAASAQTPSGGWHVWLRTPAGMPTRERRSILPGVDIKGNGGYVVAAPSWLPFSDGGGGEVRVPYAWRGWACPCAAPHAPAWMTDWMANAPAVGAGGSGGLGEVPDTEGEVTGFELGKRNISFYLAACSMYARGWADDVVIRRLRAHWDKTDQSGMRWYEVTTAAASARAFIERNRADESTRDGMFAKWLAEHGG
jgi:hypothetical protein